MSQQLMRTCLVEYSIRKSRDRTILLVKLCRLDEDDYSKIAISVIEKVRSRLYKNVVLLVRRDVDHKLLMELVEKLRELGVDVSTVWLRDTLRV